MAEKGTKGEIRGMHCIIADIRKYILAYLLNCLIKANGKNDNILYLVVET
jgi:hypothetical protein